MSIAWHAIRDHLMQSSSALGFQRSFDAIRRTQAALAPFRDSAALLDGCIVRPAIRPGRT